MESGLSEWWHWCHSPQGNCPVRDMIPDSRVTWFTCSEIPPGANSHCHTQGHSPGPGGRGNRPATPVPILRLQPHHRRAGNDGQPGSSPSCWDDHGWAGVLLNSAGILPMPSAEWTLHLVLFKEIIKSSPWQPCKGAMPDFFPELEVKCASRNAARVLASCLSGRWPSRWGNRGCGRLAHRPAPGPAPALAPAMPLVPVTSSARQGTAMGCLVLPKAWLCVRKKTKGREPEKRSEKINFPFKYTGNWG